MSEKVIRLRLPLRIYKRFKVICAEKDLSMPKQNTELIKQFVEVQEKNLMIEKDLKIG